MYPSERLTKSEIKGSPFPPPRCALRDNFLPLAFWSLKISTGRCPTLNDTPIPGHALQYCVFGRYQGRVLNIKRGTGDEGELGRPTFSFLRAVLRSYVLSEPIQHLRSLWKDEKKIIQFRVMGKGKPLISCTFGIDDQGIM